MDQRKRPPANNIRLAADIGGTFTDIAVFDDRTGNLTFGKALSTPQRLVEGINARGREGRQRLPVRRAVPARLDHRHQHHPRAHRRQDRAAHHRGLPRHLRDRPHQPAGRLQSVLPEARAAGRAGAALRGQGARARPTARSRRRSTRRRSRRSARELERLGVEAAAILFLNCYARPDHEARAKAILESNHPDMFVSASHELSAGISRVRALLDRGRQRLYRADRAPLYRRDRRAHPQRRASTARS